MFSDEKITWFRIIVIFAYGAALASDFQSRGQTEMIQQIPSVLGITSGPTYGSVNFIIPTEAFPTNVVSWIVERGGWSGIEDYVAKK